MITRFILTLAASLMAVLPATAQDAAAPPEASATLPLVELTTDLGSILIELDTENAPITAGNFLRYVTEGRYDGEGFYRAMVLGENYGLVQGGVRAHPENILPPIVHEPTTQTGLKHIDGTLSMARGGLGTATSDFFILMGAIPSLDAQEQPPADGSDTLGFAAFGRVLEGMDIVRQIAAAPRSATLGEGVMRGQMLEPTITIRTARVVLRRLGIDALPGEKADPQPADGDRANRE